MANIVSFSSLNRRNGDDGNDDDDDARRHPQSYYAGGASQRGGGSGLSVIGPDDGSGGDNIANIIERARQEALRGSSGGAASDGQPPRHVITFYRDGFTVNDGPYRVRTDPENRPFLEAIERGMRLFACFSDASVVPRELEGDSRSEQVEINLVDKRQEEYQAPPAPAYVAFSGQGQTMGSSTVAADAVIQGAAVSADRPVIDDKKPKTTLQIRLHNGTRLRETLNLDHTLRDLHAIIQLNDAGAAPYVLLAGFPPRPISVDLDQTIESAGLKGASVTQKLV